MLNLLHISDLHFTGENEGERRDYAKAAGNAILDLARDLKSSGTLGGEPKVAITGDLVQAGGVTPNHRLTDFEAVQKELLHPLQEVLGITPSDIYIVPGNHELNRDAITPNDYLLPYKACSEADANNDLRLKLNSYFDFVESHGYNSVSRETPRIETFEVSGQQIVCFNGLVGSYSRQGLADKGHLFHLPTEMAGALGKINDFAIILMHHPMSWFYDESELTLREFFARKRCRILTGHIHTECLSETKTPAGNYVTIQAGASSENGSVKFSVGVAWLPPSNSAAVRHYEFEQAKAQFPLTPASKTLVAPDGARAFFERTEAFFDPAALPQISDRASEKAAADLLTYTSIDVSSYVAPDIMQFSVDQFSGKRTPIATLVEESANVVLSGHDLSGKSSLLAYVCYATNNRQGELASIIGVSLDFREIKDYTSFKTLLMKRLNEVGSSGQQAAYLLSIGKIRVFVDNVDPNESLVMKGLLALADEFPSIRWVLATRGGERYMPSRAPADFSSLDPVYYQTSEATLPTVLKLIERHKNRSNTEKPRAVVEQVFRSIHNLSAPRSMFYVTSMLDIFLTDGSVEPLNRYLLIENLISDRIRASHREVFPGQPVDIQMLDAFIGRFAFYLLENQTQLATKAQFLTLAEEFISQKGLQRKRFDPEKVLETLIKSHVIREYSGGFGFLILSIEDYFLAKHMSQDSSFRDNVLSETGLLTLPGVAEYYVAQNPHDKPRIESIFAIIDRFESEVRPLIDQISASAIEAIQSATPGKDLNLQEELLEDLSAVDAAEEASMIKVPDPMPVGQTKRFRHSVEERGAILLQLGASVLGVTRTLDQSERVEIFKRLRSLLLTCVKGVPMIAQHLADGNEVRFRGVTVKAEYKGQLAVQDDRFYIILRGMLHNLFKRFSTWAGSPSFFNSAVQLREGEEDEFVITALYAQNIEADLSEAIAFIETVPSDVDSLVLKEILVRLYIDAMTLVPLEREDEARGIDRLVDLTAQINPPKNQANAMALKRHKDRLRKSYTDTIGLNTYVGKRISSRPNIRKS